MMARKCPSWRMPRLRGAGMIGAALLCLLIPALALVNPPGLTGVSAASSAQVTINANQTLGTLTGVSKGLNTAVWDGNMLNSAASSAIRNAGIGLLRYPGGSTSDVYHWQSNTNAPGQGTDVAGDNFDAFMNMVQSIGDQTMITVDYGAGTPTEAANWVQYAILSASNTGKSAMKCTEMAPMGLPGNLTIMPTPQLPMPTMWSPIAGL